MEKDPEFIARKQARAKDLLDGTMYLRAFVPTRNWKGRAAPTFIAEPSKVSISDVVKSAMDHFFFALWKLGEATDVTIKQGAGSGYQWITLKTSLQKGDVSNLDSLPPAEAVELLNLAGIKAHTEEASKLLQFLRTSGLTDEGLQTLIAYAGVFDKLFRKIAAHVKH